MLSGTIEVVSLQEVAEPDSITQSLPSDGAAKAEETISLSETPGDLVGVKAATLDWQPQEVPESVAFSVDPHLIQLLTELILIIYTQF